MKWLKSLTKLHLESLTPRPAREVHNEQVPPSGVHLPLSVDGVGLSVKLDWLFAEKSDSIESPEARIVQSVRVPIPETGSKLGLEARRLNPVSRCIHTVLLEI